MTEPLLPATEPLLRRRTEEEINARQMSSLMACLLFSVRPSDRALAGWGDGDGPQHFIRSMARAAENAAAFRELRDA